MQATSSSSRGNTSFLSSSPKAQPLASATPLHFQQQPSILSSGSTDFSDLSSSHREQQQLFLLSHGCRHPSSTLATMKTVERERERENKRPERKTKQRRKGGKIRRFVQRLPNRQPPAPPVATSSRQVRHIHHHHFNYILTEHACMNYHVCLLHLPARSLG